MKWLIIKSIIANIFFILKLIKEYFQNLISFYHLLWSSLYFFIFSCIIIYIQIESWRCVYRILQGTVVYARRTHAPPTTLILFSAVDVNNLAVATIRTFVNGSIVSINNFVFYYLEKDFSFNLLANNDIHIVYFQIEL